MSSAPKRFEFPTAAQLDAALHAKPAGEEIEAQDQEMRETIQQGYRDGFQAGRVAAEHAAKAMFQDAQRQGFAAGSEQGLAQAAQAVAALHQAFEQFRDWRAELANEAETFCVELVLAVLARLVDLNEDSVDFVTQTVGAAIGALAPELPHAIFVNPAIAPLVASAFPQIEVRGEAALPPGGVRLEAGRLLVESNMRQAFEKIKSAILETRDRRIVPTGASRQSRPRSGRLEAAPAVGGAD